MSEKLTVAELLARNGREAGPADTGRRRRRHRNLEKGGVSVAELTGSIPVVQTEDDTASDESAVKATDKPAAKAADKPADKAAPKAAAKDTVAAQPEKQEKKEKKLQPDQRSVSRTPERPEEQTGQLAAAKDVEDSKDVKDVKGADAEKPTFGEVARGKVVEKPEAKKEPSVKPEAEKPAKAEKAEKAEAKKAEKAEAKKATKEVKPIKPAEKPGKAEKAAKPGSAEKPGKAGVAAAAAAGGAGTAGAAGVAKSTEADAADKVGVKSRSQATSDEQAQFAQLEESLEDGEVVEYEDDTISWPMMILQAILAIAVGVGVFFGFSLIWAKAPAVLALVLAIAVTLLLVGLVHALLRHRDKLLMILAAIVGLVLTIGPRLVQGL